MVDESVSGGEDTKIQWDLRVARTQIIARRWFAIEKYKDERDYSKKTFTSKGVFEIQEALLNLGEFLERNMRESGLLGDKEDVRGL